MGVRHEIRLTYGGNVTLRHKCVYPEGLLDNKTQIMNNIMSIFEFRMIVK